MTNLDYIVATDDIAEVQLDELKDALWNLYQAHPEPILTENVAVSAVVLNAVLDAYRKLID